MTPSTSFPETHTTSSHRGKGRYSNRFRSSCVRGTNGFTKVSVSFHMVHCFSTWCAVLCPCIF